MTWHREAQSCPPRQQYPSTCLLSDGSEEPIRKPWLRAGTPKKTRTLLLPQCGGAVLCSGAVLCWGGGGAVLWAGVGRRAGRWGCAVGGGACCAVGPCCARGGGGGRPCCAAGPCCLGAAGDVLCGGRGTVLCGGDVLLPGTRRALQPETVSMLLHMALTAERPLSGSNAAPSDSFYRLTGQPDLPFQGG